MYCQTKAMITIEVIRGKYKHALKKDLPFTFSLLSIAAKTKARTIVILTTPPMKRPVTPNEFQNSVLAKMLLYLANPTNLCLVPIPEVKLSINAPRIG